MWQGSADAGLEQVSALIARYHAIPTMLLGGSEPAIGMLEQAGNIAGVLRATGNAGRESQCSGNRIREYASSIFRFRLWLSIGNNRALFRGADHRHSRFALRSGETRDPARSRRESQGSEDCLLARNRAA